MKKTLLALLIGALLLGLGGCQEPAAQPEKIPEENSMQTGTKSPEISSKEESALPEPLSAKMRVLVETVYRDEIDDASRPLLTAAIAKPTVAIEGRADAQKAINDSLSGQFDAYMADADASLQLAKEDLGDENRQLGDAWNGYGLTSSVVIGRMDERVFSLTYQCVNYTGGSHPNHFSLGVSYDAQTGETLYFESLTDDIKRFEETVAQALRAQFASPAYAQLLYDDAALKVADVLDQQAWYLSAQGLEIICNPYVIAPHAAGVLRFTIAYADLADVLQPRWLPVASQAQGAGLRLAKAAEQFSKTDAVIAEVAGQTVLLAADGVITDVRICRVSADENGNFQEFAQLYACNRMGPDDAIALTALLPESMPNLMLTYTLADGETRAYAVSESGKDGRLLLMDLTGVWRPSV